MEIRQLRTFQAVANLLSFNRAAERLHYAQSSVSAQIHALEEELGVQLFDRLGRRIVLTEAGAQLLNYAEKIVNLADETLAEVTETSTPQGALTVRVPETLAVHHFPAIIKGYHLRFPGVKLQFTTCALEGLEKDLRKGLIDLAFLLAESITAADLTAEVLRFESLILVASSDHPLSQKRSVATCELSEETFLFSKVDCSYRKIFEGILVQSGITYENSIEFYSVEAVKRSVIEGVGIALLPEIAVAEEVAKNRLAVLPWSENKIDVAVLMIWHRERWLSPALKAFIDITRKGIGGNNLRP
jgi:DNA-binding transcriptional LysR family regulator